MGGWGGREGQKGEVDKVNADMKRAGGGKRGKVDEPRVGRWREARAVSGKGAVEGVDVS